MLVSSGCLQCVYSSGLFADGWNGGEGERGGGGGAFHFREYSCVYIGILCTSN